jgi:hypothetical protein
MAETQKAIHRRDPETLRKTETKAKSEGTETAEDTEGKVPGD